MASAEEALPRRVTREPNEALLNLTARTGYTIRREKRERKYGGPPPDWESRAPLKDCGIFVGGIPKDCYEDELVPVFEKIEKIYELKLVTNRRFGPHRGYGFVTYTNKEHANQAVKELHNYEIRKGQLLCVRNSSKVVLHVGNLMSTTTEDKIRKLCSQVVGRDNAVGRVKKIRDYAFIRFSDKDAAIKAMAKLNGMNVEGAYIEVAWAKGREQNRHLGEVDRAYNRGSEALKSWKQKEVSSVRCVEILKALDCHLGEVDRAYNRGQEALESWKQKEVSSVRANQDCHLGEVDRAYNRGPEALESWKQKEVSPIRANQDCHLGEVDRAYNRGQEALESWKQKEVSCVKANQDYHLGEVDRAYNRGQEALESWKQKEVSYVRANQDCHLGEVDRAYNRGPEALESWKQKEVSPVRGYGYDPSYSPPLYYNPMSPPPASRALAGRGPMGIRSPVRGRGMMLRGCGFRKHPAEVLDDLCQKNGWGSPVYQLHSLMGRGGSGAQQLLELFLYKITIPALGTQFPNRNPFTPNKLCPTVEGAKVFAAEYTLMQLGVPLEALEFISPPCPYTQPSYANHPDPPVERFQQIL
ncbi:APOBEC1 complementation factor-like [Liolophura sinensis]|uniref:APOBEC1 complementation factor-like n=1 Tax=Liolophura sinensis TaxID=3198878 RepID=UPI00315831DA